VSEPTDRIEKNGSCSPRSLPVYVRSKSSQLKRAKVREIDNEEVNSTNKDRAYVWYIRQKWEFGKHRLPSIIRRPAS